jgi:hypothetical protein
MKSAIATLLSVLLAATPAWADERSLHWSELSAFIADHSITLTLPDGARIEGRAIAVEPQRLIVDVRKTSDPQGHARGRQLIPRSQAQVLVVNRPTVRWRIIGTTVGAGAGVPLGAVVALEKDGLFGGKGNGTGIIVALIAGLAAVGFLIGWAADRRKTTVTVISEPSAE